MNKLSLASWNLGNDGVRSFCHGLMNNFKIKDINLSRNHFSDWVISNLMRPLLSRGCLIEHLDLSENDIGDSGATLLAEWIELNKVIRGINLKNNLIQSEGGKAIRNALFNQTSSNLIMLSLNQNPIDIKLAEEIDDMIYGTTWNNKYLDNKLKDKKDTSRLRYEK